MLGTSIEGDFLPCRSHGLSDIDTVIRLVFRDRDVAAVDLSRRIRATRAMRLEKGDKSLAPTHLIEWGKLHNLGRTEHISPF